jgi:hypothetical protein
MKLLLIALIVPSLFCGCVTAKYNPKTGEILYQRIGDQKVSGVIVERSPDGAVSVLIESQQSEARLMQDAIGLFKAGMEAAKK